MTNLADEITAAKSALAAGQIETALTLWQNFLAQQPDHVVGLIGVGDCLMALKRPASAAESYARALDLRPDIPALLLALGTAEIAAGKPEQARDHLQAFLAQDDSNPHGHNNLAIALSQLGDRAGAERHYHRALALKPDMPAVKPVANSAIKTVRHPVTDWQKLFDAGLANLYQGNFTEAKDRFQSVLLAQPQNHMAWESLGVAELGLGHGAKALKALDEALKLAPHSLGALHHRAIALRAQGRLEDAIHACDELLKLDPGNVHAASVRGSVNLESGRLMAAIPDLEAAIAGDTGDNRPALQAALAFALRATCQWGEQLDQIRTEIQDALARDLPRLSMLVVSPFHAIPLGLSGEAQAELGARASRKAAASVGKIPAYKKYLRDDMRVRIGYLSPDFSNHSVATAMHEVIACHDRTKFAVEGFSLGRANDQMTQKLKGDFDNLYDVSGMNHGEAAAFIAHRHIDILIELAGHTKGGRMEILAYKPAPIQISAIGYGGPISADFIPWHLVDRHLVPPTARKFYREKLIDLPDCALPASRPVNVAKGMTRAEAGFPETGVVLANFGGSYKIDSYSFDAWMKILQAAPNACLALLDNTEPVNDRLRARATDLGIEASRLVFVPFVERSQHLARYAHVDLCLDTLTHNGGVTTTDALWLGAPVLTLQRDDLPDRMGPSVLYAAGLAELVAKNIDDFVQKAVALASDAAATKALRARVLTLQKSAPLYDVGLYTRNLEAALLDLMARSVDNHFEI